MYGVAPDARGGSFCGKQKKKEVMVPIKRRFIIHIYFQDLIKSEKLSSKGGM